MNCDEADELLAAYGLAALSPEKQAAMRQHVAGCDRHARALAEVEADVARLALTVEEREPPAALREGLLEAFDAAVALQSREQPTPMPPARLGPATATRRPPFAYIAAIAALLLVAVGLAAWNVALQLGDGDGGGTVVAEFAGALGEGQMLYLEDKAILVLTTDLPEPPAGRVYQVWGLFDSDSEAISLGFAPGRGVAAMNADLSEATAVAISEEPTGGSRQPTTDPLVVASLR